MPNLIDLVDQIRIHVNDYTRVQVNVVEETPATAKASPLDSVDYWNTTATGVNYEEFLTKHMPLVSGSFCTLRGGRWNYAKIGEYPNDYSEPGTRGSFIDYDRGIFIVPSGSPPIDSGGKVKLSYSWWEELEYRFTDSEIYKQISNGDSYLREKGMSVPYFISGYGDTLSFTPFPSGIIFSALALSSSYFIRRRLEEEAIQDGIWVRDGDSAFDTTKTLAHRGKSLEQVKKDLDSIIHDLIMKDLKSAGAKIDIYSTRDQDYPGGHGSDQEYLYGGDFDTNGQVM